jgi:hypothetical protein
MNLDQIFDDMARRFAEADRDAVPIEEIIKQTADAGIGDAWTCSKQAMTNAMRVRGIDVRSGMLCRADDDREHFEPVMTDYMEFRQAAKRAIQEAGYPIDTMDLANRTGLNHSAIPLVSMSIHLRKEGIHFLPGVGYWTAPSYTDPSGRIVSRRCRSERAQALIECFETLGWPLVGRDVERHTNGLVTSRFLTTYAADSGRATVAGLGGGLYVPADKRDSAVIPMSRNVALAMQSLEPETMIDDQDGLRLFRLATLFERKGLATVRKSRSSRGGKRVQTARIEYNKAGLQVLERVTRQTADEF